MVSQNPQDNLSTYFTDPQYIWDFLGVMLHCEQSDRACQTVALSGATQAAAADGAEAKWYLEHRNQLHAGEVKVFQHTLREIVPPRKSEIRGQVEEVTRTQPVNGIVWRLN